MESKARKIGEICFWIGLFIEIAIVIIDKSAYINPLESQLFRLTFLLFGIKVATSKFSWKEWLCILGVGLIAAISYLIHEKDEVVRVVVFVAACKDMPLKKVMKATFWTTLAGCFIIVFLSVTGIFGETAMIADFGRCVVETRYHLGMGHPNAFHCMVFVLIVLAIYIYHSYFKWYHFLCCFLINIGAFYLSDSNTGMLVTTAFIVVAVFFQYMLPSGARKWLYIGGAGILAFCIVFSILGAIFGDGVPILHEFDDLINGRYKSAYLIENARLVNWKLFGMEANTEYFDAGYIRLFYWYGIIPSIVYLLAHFYLIYLAYRYHDDMLLLMIVMFSGYSLFEAHLISVYMLRNYLFILFGYYWCQPFLGKDYNAGYCWQFKKLLGKA